MRPTPNESSHVTVRPVDVRLNDVPIDELRTLATELGLDGRSFQDRSELSAAIHDRRAMIANLDREALLDVLRWAHRRASPLATNEQLAVEIVRVRSMRFAGLSHRGLVALARLRGIDIEDNATTPDVVAKLKDIEGLFSKLNRKRRAFVGKMVSRMIGDDSAPSTTPEQSSNAPRESERNIRHEIEESGLIAGITSRVKRSADQYINQKLDEIEQRIDRKLDEIDRRLGEWRDKEIANRIRILKISLWATVIVGIVTLTISYFRVRWMNQ
ncbi:MAG TPA: hypothetical protein PK402_08070 [Tepidisphaeraceae bacterium]|nr:hypothetical protein [Tepidisphaeraceae bacterium]